MPIQKYIASIAKRYHLGNSTEHTFRGDLQNLIESLVPGVCATNEPKRQACGAPDYILTRKEIPVGFIEAKDIDDKDLKGQKKIGNKEQFDRYRASLDNLIITDYLRFHLYLDGQFVTEIEIGKNTIKGIEAIPENFDSFKSLITSFCAYTGQTIKSPKKLAEMMAGKARLLSGIIEKSIIADVDNNDDSTLKDQMLAFKQILLHDITAKGFSDVYSQTIAYGMFAARLHDKSLDSFSRQEAAELIPKSNPFLRNLFGYISGPQIDDRIKWVVDSLAQIFLACDVEKILSKYGRSTGMEDPIIHFYETFLTEYDPKVRKSRGVWYTPKPIVQFIVRSVDEVLKNEFGLKQGLADTTKAKVKVDIQGKLIEQEVHKVQILDPATGTGTFLSEVVTKIHDLYSSQQGIWSDYVERHLIPRLNGFEILMASYAMAHLKLDLLLKDTGYIPTKDQRFKIYLTNSLEEHHPDTGTMFTTWLSAEANEANHIKRDTPVMCILGNPPYNEKSANRGKWISDLMESYKKEPGGKIKLKEKNSKSINDDYVKFLRFGQYYIEKNGSGVLAYICPHGFLDNPTFRGMRWNLLNTYDKIFVFDLHGNFKKKEVAQDGSADENVFNIEQGVSICFFIKTGGKKPKELGRIFNSNIYGKREDKFKYLSVNSLSSTNFKEVMFEAPHYYFVEKNFIGKKEYSKGFLITDLFPFKTSGVKTHDDAHLVADTIENLKEKVISKHFNFEMSKVVKYAYRPFDNGFIYYDAKLLGRAREKTIHHLKKNNIGLILVPTPKAANVSEFDCVFVTESYTDTNMYRRGGPYIFPLYLYPDINDLENIASGIEKVANISQKIADEISKNINIKYDENGISDSSAQSFTPIDIFDYVYSVLHSNRYRSKYKDFLLVEYPRIPYPINSEYFWNMVAFGRKLRNLHLLNDIDQLKTTYPVSGGNIVESAKYLSNRIYINEFQYFENVQESVWNYTIGGYEPIQKWIKDRKEQILGFDEIINYQKIIESISDTISTAKDIDALIHI